MNVSLRTTSHGQKKLVNLTQYIHHGEDIINFTLITTLNIKQRWEMGRVPVEWMYPDPEHMEWPSPSHALAQRNIWQIQAQIRNTNNERKLPTWSRVKWDEKRIQKLGGMHLSCDIIYWTGISFYYYFIIKKFWFECNWINKTFLTTRSFSSGFKGESLTNVDAGRNFPHFFLKPLGKTLGSIVWNRHLHNQTTITLRKPVGA